MAYDLIVSKDIKGDKAPKHLGSLDYTELPLIASLLAGINCNFLSRLQDPYKDQIFGPQDLIQAQGQLHELMTSQLGSEEKALLYKLVAILGYAIGRGENLYGVAD